jgi:hypothetical protein
MSRITLAVLATLTLGSAVVYADSITLNSDLNVAPAILDLSPSTPAASPKKSTTQGAVVTENLATGKLAIGEMLIAGNVADLGLVVSPRMPETSAPERTVAAAGLHPIGLMVAVATTAIIPEPSTVVLMGLGAVGMLYAAWRRRRSA